MHHFDSKLALPFHPALSDALPDRLIHHNAKCKRDVYSHHDDDGHTDLLAVLWNYLWVSREQQKVLH